MSKILYDMDTMKFSTLFEKITHTKLKDCFKDEDSVVFVVMPGYMAKAIGKKGANVKKMQNILKKNIVIVEYSSDILEFVKNQVNVNGVEFKKEDEDVVVVCPNNKTKGLVFGREKQRLKKLNDLVGRYFKGKVKVE